MSQPSLLTDLRPRMDGATFDAAQDGPRLTLHLEKVRCLLSTGRPWTAADIGARVGCSEAAASARCRDLRKAKFGAHDVRCERVHGGLWFYRMVGQ